jgi:hypothetical protein
MFVRFSNSTERMCMDMDEGWIISNFLLTLLTLVSASLNYSLFLAIPFIYSASPTPSPLEGCVMILFKTNLFFEPHFSSESPSYMSGTKEGAGCIPKKGLCMIQHSILITRSHSSHCRANTNIFY